jgi:hypothetical protein
MKGGGDVGLVIGRVAARARASERRTTTRERAATDDKDGASCSLPPLSLSLFASLLSFLLDDSRHDAERDLHVADQVVLVVPGVLHDLLFVFLSWCAFE